jgi:hypothetical protein
MNTKLTVYASALKSLKPRDFVYPILLLVFFIAVIVFFILAVKFISENINNIFVLKEAKKESALDVARYTFVAKKLHIPPDASKETRVFLDPQIEINTASISEKNSVSILILNSTKKPGLAGVLANILKEAGFSSITTGNEKTPRTATTILAGAGKETYASLVLESVIKAYPAAYLATSTEQTRADVTIIIGVK